MKHTVIVYGKLKGHGKMRKNRIEFTMPILSSTTRVAINARKWFVENYKNLGPTPEELK
jgi:hypothetical protein